MGWLFHPVEAARYHNRNAEIDRIFTPANPEFVTFTILQRSWHGSTCYVACRTQNKESGADYTGAAVILTKSYMEDGQRWWGYKDMDETMMPYYFDAPKSLIQKLTPTDCENSNKWRQACLERSRTKAQPKPTKFRTQNLLNFIFQNLGPRQAQEFERVEMPRRRNVYKCLDLPGQPLVRLNSLDFANVEALA